MWYRCLIFNLTCKWIPTHKKPTPQNSILYIQQIISVIISSRSKSLHHTFMTIYNVSLQHKTMKNKWIISCKSNQPLDLRRSSSTSSQPQVTPTLGRMECIFLFFCFFVDAHRSNKSMIKWTPMYSERVIWFLNSINLMTKHHGMQYTLNSIISTSTISLTLYYHKTLGKGCS